MSELEQRMRLMLWLCFWSIPILYVQSCSADVGIHYGISARESPVVHDILKICCDTRNEWVGPIPSKMLCLWKHVVDEGPQLVSNFDRIVEL